MQLTHTSKIFDGGSDLAMKQKFHFGRCVQAHVHVPYM